MESFLTYSGIALIILACGVAFGILFNGVPPLIQVTKNYYHPSEQEAHPDEFEY